MLVIALAGAPWVPDYARPGVERPDAFKSDHRCARIGGSDPELDWWRLYNDPMLDEPHRDRPTNRIRV